MKLPVLVEPAKGAGFIAKIGSPFNWTAEGATAIDAVAKLQEETKCQLSNGRTTASVDVPETTHPWRKWAGTWTDESVVDQFRAAVEEYRQQRDLEDGIEYDDAAQPITE